MHTGKTFFTEGRNICILPCMTYGADYRRIQDVRVLASMSNCGNSRDIDFIVVILKSVSHAKKYIYVYTGSNKCPVLIVSNHNDPVI